MTTLENKLSKYQYAFNLANDIQDFPRQVIILDKIGNVHREMGNFREANAMFSIALGITHDHNLRYEQGQILVSMGWNFLIAGAISPAVYYNLTPDDSN